MRAPCVARRVAVGQACTDGAVGVRVGDARANAAGGHTQPTPRIPPSNSVPALPPTHSCAVALLAQFYPGKPPATTPLLAACVAAYAALSAGLTAVATFVERDSFLFTKGGGGYPPLAVGARMARFDPGYELIVEERGGGKGGKSARAVASLNATALVRSDGRVDKGAVAAAVAGVLTKFDAAAKRK